MRGIANRVTFNTLIEALGQVSHPLNLPRALPSRHLFRTTSSC